MGIEIERKFLVDNGFSPVVDGVIYRQGYLSTDPQRVVRVRIAGEKGYLTIKGCVQGISCPEYEYSIPMEDATQILETLCDGIEVCKIRYAIPFKGFIWEVDVFEGKNSGLVMAEVELESESDSPELPAWIGQEVTGDRRYYNAYLSQHPYTEWKTDK